MTFNASKLRFGFSICLLAAFCWGTLTAADGKTVPSVDLFGEPLPEGASARLGTLKWRHGNKVTFVAYTNDGKEVVSSCGDGVFYVWDVESGKRLRFFGEERKVNPNTANSANVAFQEMRSRQTAVSPDGKLLATSSTDGKIRLWDITAGKEQRVFDHGHQPYPGFLVFTPDGKTLLSRGMQDQKIKVWDPTTGKLTREIDEQPNKTQRAYFGGTGNPLAVSPDGKWISGVVVEFDNRAWVTSLRIWDLAEGKEFKSIKDESGGGLRGLNTSDCPVFSPDAKQIAWPRFNAGIQLFEVSTRKEGPKLTDENADSQILRLLWCADGKTLACLTTNQTIDLYDATSGKKLKTIGEEPDGPQGKAAPKALRANRIYSFYGVGFTPSPDGKTFAQGWGNLIRFWNVETGKSNDPAGGHYAELQGVTVSEDGKSVFTVGVDNTLRKWDLATSKETQRVNLPVESTMSLMIHATCVVVRNNDGVLTRWNPGTGKEVLKLEASQGTQNIFAVSLDGKTIVTSTADQLLRLFNLETGKELGTIKDLQTNNAPNQINRKYIYGLDCTEDASGVAVQYQTSEMVPQPGGGARYETRHTIRYYDVESGTIVWESTSSTQCRGFQLSPDGRSLVVVHADGLTTTVLDTLTGKERYRLDANGIMPMFSQDGRFLAMGTMDGGAKVIDVRAGKTVASFQGHLGRVPALAFSPDSTTLFTGGAEGTTLVWDIRELVQKAKNDTEVNAETTQRLWGELGDVEAGKAYKAVVALSASPKQTIARLKDQMKPAQSENPQLINKLLAQLDNDEFEIRRNAFQQLAKLGGQARPAMKKILEGDPSLEVRKQLEELIEQAAPGRVALTPETLRELRAIEVLENIGTPEARQLLESLAKGSPGMRLTSEAAAALKRIGK